MFILIPLCLGLMALQIRMEHREHYHAATLLKGLASLCFVLFGILTSTGGKTAGQIVTGLVLGFVADVLLSARYAFPKKGKIIFLVGILVFLAGHLVYLAAIVRLCEKPLLCAGVGVLLTAVLMKWIFTRITAEKVFKIFGIVYIGAITVMTCTAVGNLISAPSAFTGLFAAGAVLFLVSDLVLILNTFGPESRFGLRILNLSLYYIGQLMIAGSLLFLG